MKNKEITTVETVEDRGRKRPYGTGGLIQKVGCKNWIAVFWQNGKQVQRSTGTKSKMVAEAKLLEFRGDAQRGQAKPSKKLRYEDIRRKLISDYQRKGNRSLIQRQDGTFTINMGLHHVDSFFANMPVVKINDDVIENYVAQRQQAGAEAGTINRELSMLRRMFKLAIKTAPPAFPFLRETNIRKGFVEDQQFERILSAIPDSAKSKLHPLLMFLFWTGCRVGAAQQICWEQVDLDKCEVRLDSEQTKNAEAQTLPLPIELVELLRPQQPQQRAEGHVFYQGAFRKTWKHACERAGVPQLLVHDLRRSAVRNLTAAGVPQVVAMSISGHKTASVFRRYNIVDAKQMHQAFDQVRQHKLNGNSSGSARAALTD